MIVPFCLFEGPGCSYTDEQGNLTKRILSMESIATGPTLEIFDSRSLTEIFMYISEHYLTGDDSMLK